MRPRQLYSAPVRHPHHRPLLALVLRAVASFLIATLFMLAKLAGQHNVAVLEMLFWLQFVTVPLMLSWTGARGKLHDLATMQIRGHFLRAMVGLTSGAFCFAAARMLSLSEFTALTFTAPIFAVLITAIVLCEHVGLWRWGAVVCGFVGVVVIARPGEGVIPLIGGILAMLAALTTSITNFQIRGLARTDDPLRVVFWYAVIGSLIMVGFLPFYARGHDMATWALLLSIGVAGALVQLTLATSLLYGSVTSVIVLDSTQLLWATVYIRSGANFRSKLCGSARR